MSDFCWVEGYTKVKDLIKQLAKVLTEPIAGKEICKWTLEYPTTLESVTNTVILKTSTSFRLDTYIKLQRPERILNYIEITMGKSIITDSETSEKDIDTVSSNEPTKFAWYKQNNDIELFDWTAIQYWLSFNQDFINIVLQGDPSLDIPPYKNYLISYAYIGALESFADSEQDNESNFGLTTSSDTMPEVLSEKYGKRTATCITDIGMLATKSGLLFQAHLPKFSTCSEFTDKNFISSSQWTHKYHMSDIVIFHAYDRERGKLQNVLIGDRSAINHLDILVMDKGLTDKDGNSLEKHYKMFNINAPYSILNNGPNVLYGIALRKTVE